jgi:hypothetical protein
MENKTVEINETEYNIREQNEVYNTDDIFYNKLKAVQYTKDPLGDLASANSAIIYYGYSNCSLRCCIPCILSCNCSCNCSCSEIYKYNSFVKVGDFEKFLFTNLAYLDCGIDKSCRFNKCTNLTFSSYNDYCTNNGIQFSYMDKNKECTACGFCESLLKVYLTKENKLVGIVKFRGYCEECICCKDKCNLGCGKFCTCYDYSYCCEILDHNNEVKYYIYKKKCCLCCIPNDCCGEINFLIKNKDKEDDGKITCIKDCCPCYGICGLKFIYNIEFPKDCTSELKLTIINAIISIDIFYE